MYKISKLIINDMKYGISKVKIGGLKSRIFDRKTHFFEKQKKIMRLNTTRKNYLQDEPIKSIQILNF